MPNFSIPWNTFSAADGPHTVHAVVRDTSGNTVTTSTITVTVSNIVPPGEDPPPEVEEPPTPPPPPIIPPVLISTTSIPLGAIFYNTLGEFSTFIAEAVFPSATNPDLDSFTDDWIDVVRDMGVTGIGNETDKVQAAIDLAASNAAAGSGRTRVLIPSSVEVSVGPVEDDTCTGTEYGPVGVCLWLYDGVHVQVNGTLKAAYDYTYTYANNTVTIFETVDSFTGSSNENITIDGTGTIDLEGIYSSGVVTEDGTFTAAKQIKHIMALRAYSASKVTVKDLTIKHGVGEKFQIGFSDHVDFNHVKFDTALIYDDVSAPENTALINLDVCREVNVSGCYAVNCKAYKGVAIWASKGVVLDGNNFSDLVGVTNELVDVLGTPVWFVDYGMEFGSTDMDNDQDIYDLDEGLDARLMVSNNILCRNSANGIHIRGGALQGALTDGINIHNNIICSNAINGILIDGLKDFEISGNHINNNGWGADLIFD